MGRMATMNEPIELLGRDSIGIALGSPYQHFRSPTGCRGLACIEGDRLEILAVSATIPGQGQCRAFVADCKRAFASMIVLHVDNPVLRAALKRWGFRPYRRTNPDGEKLTGWRWTR